MGALGEVLASIALKFLQAWLQRLDVKNEARLELLLQLEEVGNAAARRALEWKASAAASPDGGASLRVRPGAGRIELQGKDSSPERGDRAE